MNNRTRRRKQHDYSQPYIYMVTLIVRDRLPLLGTLVGRSNPHIELSPLGHAFVEGAIPQMLKRWEMLEVWRKCIMPDHVHLIVRVNAPMPQGKTLGTAIGGLKAGGSKALWQLQAAQPGRVGEATASPSSAQATAQPGRVGEATASPPRLPLFEPGFNDRILTHAGQLEAWKHYLNDNPRRLWLKRQHKDLFTVLRAHTVLNYTLNMVGNIFLLDYPDKMAVIYHRHYTEAEFQMLVKQWFDCGQRGGVLVSAAVHPRERDVMREAFLRGYKIIKLNKNGFPELYKPCGHSFDACLEGRLLEISPWEHNTRREVITRAECLYLNDLAQAIACYTRPREQT